MGDPQQRRLMTLDETAAYLRIQPRTLRAWLREGEGPPHARIRRMLRFDPDDVDAWVRGQRVDPAERSAVDIRQCEECGADIRNDPRGRKRRFCGTRCQQRHAKRRRKQRRQEAEG